MCDALAFLSCKYERKKLVSLYICVCGYRGLAHSGSMCFEFKPALHVPMRVHMSMPCIQNALRPEGMQIILDIYGRRLSRFKVCKTPMHMYDTCVSVAVRFAPDCCVSSFITQALSKVEDARPG